MRVALHSDLHLEFAAFKPPALDVEVVVLAGDIAPKLNGLRFMCFERRTGEAHTDFLRRVRSGEGAGGAGGHAIAGPALAVLYCGDLALPEGSSVYALFREGTVPTLSASDLIS